MSPSAQAVEAIMKSFHAKPKVGTDFDGTPEDRLKEIIDRAYSAKLAAIEALKPYLGHWPNCESAERHPCNCGFKQALAAYAATETNEQLP